MIIVQAIVETSESDVEALRGALREMEEASQAEEGCHGYTFCQQVSSPDVLWINELWESMEALRAHFTTPHMARFNAAVAEHPPKSITLRVHELGEELSLAP